MTGPLIIKRVRNIGNENWEIEFMGYMLCQEHSTAQHNTGSIAGLGHSDRNRLGDCSVPDWVGSAGRVGKGGGFP